MKKTLLLITAIALAGLFVLKKTKLQEPSDKPLPAPAEPSAARAVPPVDEEPVAAGQSGLPAPASVAAEPTAGPIPEPSERFKALIAELRPKVDAALLASDFQAADRHVDELLATEKLEPLEKQRLMVVKMASRGMRGDHAAMLELMDEIIALAPDSPLSAGLRRERGQIEKIQRLGPNHPGLCGTCGQLHAPGKHADPKKNAEPENQD